MTAIYHYPPTIQVVGGCEVASPKKGRSHIPFFSLSFPFILHDSRHWGVITLVGSKEAVEEQRKGRSTEKLVFMLGSDSMERQDRHLIPQKFVLFQNLCWPSSKFKNQTIKKSENPKK